MREFLKLTKDMLEEMVEQFIRNQVRDFVGADFDLLMDLLSGS